MNAMRSLGLLGAAAIAAAACGTTVIDGTGGQGGSGASGGSGGSVPDQCAVTTSLSPPFATTFRFANTGPAPVFLHQGCYLEFDVTSCASGYAGSLALHADCTIDCNDPLGGCIACGACWDGATTLDAGTTYDDTWAGSTYTFGTNGDGCSCHVGSLAPAGKYRVVVPVWDADPSIDWPPPSRTVTVDFDLPAVGGVVTIPVAP